MKEMDGMETLRLTCIMGSYMHRYRLPAPLPYRHPSIAVLSWLVFQGYNVNTTDLDGKDCWLATSRRMA